MELRPTWAKETLTMSDITTDDIKDSTESVPEDALDVDQLDDVAGGMHVETLHENLEA
jgi:hypothetical protein